MTLDEDATRRSSGWAARRAIASAVALSLTTLLNGVGAVDAQGADDAWTFLSIPDLFNADYADLSGGADPEIAAVFGPDYGNGLVAAPNWESGGPNSMNPEFAAVLHRSIDDMVASAGGSPELVMIAGDLTGGRWPQNEASLRSMFGDDDTSLAELLDRAAASYYSWSHELFAESGVDTVLAAVGDHDIGDNDWRVGTPRGDNVDEMKRAFGEHMVDPVFAGLAGRPDARAANERWADIRFAPDADGPGEYDEAAFVYQERNLLVVTVDVFRYEGPSIELSDRTGTVAAEVVGPQLDWLRRVLQRAEAEPTVDHVIVQGHTPILGPVNTNRSSGLLLRGGENSPLWQTLADFGTAGGGKVRSYLAGEVHATTTIQDPASGIVQISHGALVQAIRQNFDNSDPTYIAVEVTPERLELTEYTIDLDRRGDTSVVFEVDRPISTTHDTYVSGPSRIGSITLSSAPADPVVAASGTLTVARSVSSADPSDDLLIGLTGDATITQGNRWQWHRVRFDQPLDDPIVVMGPATLRGSQEAFARVRSVTNEGFEFQIDEWNYLDGRHLTETVSWMAVERGVHDLGDGDVLEANALVGRTRRLSFPLAGGFEHRPVLFGQVATANGSDAVTVRFAEIEPDQYEVYMQEEEASFLGPVDAPIDETGTAAYGPFNDRFGSLESRIWGWHTTERIDVIAITRGSYEALTAGLRSGLEDTDRNFVVEHGRSDLAPSGLLAQLQDVSGLNPATPRLVRFRDDDMVVRVQEEKSYDPETDRSAEDDLAWLVFAPGTLLFENGVMTR